MSDNLVSDRIKKVASIIGVSLRNLSYDTIMVDQRKATIKQRLSIVDRFYNDDNIDLVIKARNRTMERVEWFINRVTSKIDDGDITDNLILMLYVKMFEDIIGESIKSILFGTNNHFGAYSSILSQDHTVRMICRFKNLTNLYVGSTNVIVMTTTIEIADVGEISFDLVKNYCHSNIVRDSSIDKDVSLINNLIKENNMLVESNVDKMSIIMED